jgi:hypothetical protein
MDIAMPAPFAAFALFAVLTTLLVGGGVVLIVAIVGASHRRQTALDSAEGARELRDEMRAMHESMEARLADITLMLDDMQQRQRPPTDDVG